MLSSYTTQKANSCGEYAIGINQEIKANEKYVFLIII